MARFEVGDNVMVLTEAIRGRKGIIQRILNDNLQDDPKGSRFIVQTEGSDKFNMMSVRDIAWINHAEDEKNKTGGDHGACKRRQSGESVGSSEAAV